MHMMVFKGWVIMIFLKIMATVFRKRAMRLLNSKNKEMRSYETVVMNVKEAWCRFEKASRVYLCVYSDYQICFTNLWTEVILKE